MPGFNLSEYEPVEDRIRAFWEDHPAGRISTNMEDAPEGEFVFVACVYRVADDAAAAATGWAREVVAQLPQNMKASALEVCETSAIGRALANLGYAPKGKRPSREEMSKSAGPTEAPASPQQDASRESPSDKPRPAPAAEGATSDGDNPSTPRSGGVAPSTTSGGGGDEDPSPPSDDTSVGVPEDFGEGSKGTPADSPTDYRAAVKKRGYTAGQVLTKLKALGTSYTTFDAIPGDDIAWAMDELDKAKGRVA